jgi:hypothetical protein
VLDIGGTYHTGIILPIQISLEVLQYLAMGCPKLQHIGYFCSDHISGYLASVLFLDNKTKWTSLISASWFTPPASLNELLRILSGTKWFSENVEVTPTSGLGTEVVSPPSLEADAMNNGKSAEEDEGDTEELKDEDKTNYLNVLNAHDKDDGDSDSSSDEGKSDFTNLEYLYSRNEIALERFVMKDNRDDLGNLTSEEIGDSISYLRHFITLVTNEIKKSNTWKDFSTMKTVLMNRHGLKVGFLTSIGQSCAFLPRNLTNG